MGNGIEGLFHSFNSLWKAGYNIGTSDIANAFNSFSRDRMLFKVYRNYPEIYNFVELCYGERLKITIDYRYSVPSEKGSQQGDPLSPLLFCLMIQGAINKLRSNPVSNVVVAGYCDDVCFTGKDAHAVSETMDKFARLVDIEGLRGSTDEVHHLP